MDKLEKLALQKVSASYNGGRDYDATKILAALRKRFPNKTEEELNKAICEAEQVVFEGGTLK